MATACAGDFEAVQTVLTVAIGVAGGFATAELVRRARETREMPAQPSIHCLECRTPIDSVPELPVQPSNFSCIHIASASLQMLIHTAALSAALQMLTAAPGSDWAGSDHAMRIGQADSHHAMHIGQADLPHFLPSAG